MNKIVFIDIDENLREDNGKIKKSIKDQVKKLRNNDYMVALCTGKSYSEAKIIAEELGTNEYIISSNGGEVLNMNTNEVIYNSVMPKKDLEKILKYCQDVNVNMLINTLDGDYQSKNEEQDRQLVTSIEEIKVPISQIVLSSLYFDRMLAIPRMFAAKYPNIKINSTSKSLKLENRHPKNEYYHDFNALGVSKNNGIIELLNHLNIEPENAIAIIDNQNGIDSSMITSYRLSTKNITDSLRDTITEITQVEDNCFSYFASKLFS